MKSGEGWGKEESREAYLKANYLLTTRRNVRFGTLVWLSRSVLSAKYLLLTWLALVTLGLT